MIYYMHTEMRQSLGSEQQRRWSDCANAQADAPLLFEHGINRFSHDVAHISLFQKIFAHNPPATWTFYTKITVPRQILSLQFILDKHLTLYYDQGQASDTGLEGLVDNCRKLQHLQLSKVQTKASRFKDLKKLLSREKFWIVSMSAFQIK